MRRAPRPGGDWRPNSSCERLHEDALVHGYYRGLRRLEEGSSSTGKAVGFFYYLPQYLSEQSRTHVE